MGFDNIERNRYYGLRVGDIVSPKGISGEEWHKGTAEVIDYGSDNNRVCIKSKDGTIIDWVAEWCDIITKVEDIKSNLIILNNDKYSCCNFCLSKDELITFKGGDNRITITICKKCAKELYNLINNENRK